MTATHSKHSRHLRPRAFGWRPLPFSSLVVLLALGCGTPEAQVPAPVPVQEQQLVQAPPPAIDEPMPETVVYAKFQSNTQVIKPGGKFLLAVYLDIVGDYRISWTNPGDIGRETKVEFGVPRGFKVGPVQFPAPQRFTRSDGAVSYGYEGETAVFAEVQAPRHLSSSKVYRFDVKADWVACKKECATEEITAWFEMISQRNAPRPRLSQELRPHYDALPRSFKDHSSSTHDWKNSRALVFHHGEETKWVDFIPGSLDQPKLLGFKQTAKGVELRFERGPNQPIVGLLVAEEQGQTAFYDVHVTRP